MCKAHLEWHTANPTNSLSEQLWVSQKRLSFELEQPEWAKKLCLSSNLSMWMNHSSGAEILKKKKKVF